MVGVGEWTGQMKDPVATVPFHRGKSCPRGMWHGLFNEELCILCSPEGTDKRPKCSPASALFLPPAYLLNLVFVTAINTIKTTSPCRKKDK